MQKTLLANCPIFGGHYVHMAVLLNELFFPQSDPLTTQLLAAFAFCSTFMLRPIGGFLIGLIGDHIGRKSTIIITTSLMALCCITMASIGTYAEIGITASIVMLLCRGLQGICSLGEAIGASLYLVETLKQPYRYIASGLIELGARVGGLFALAVASFAISIHFNWRIAFWIGAVIAVIGFFARVRLRETNEFVDYKRRLQIKAELNKQNPKLLKELSVYKEKIDKKAVLAYFLIRLVFPACAYITYIYLGGFMKESLGMTAEQVIHQNLKLTIVTVIVLLIFIFFLKKYHPIKIAEQLIKIFLISLPIIPFCLNHLQSSLELFGVQLMTFSIAACAFSVEVACFKYIPIANRFTILATTFGISSALSTAVITFSLIPLAKYFGHYAIWFIYVPVVIGFAWGVAYVKKLEEKNGKYTNYPQDDNPDNPDTALIEEDYGYDFQEKETYSAYNVNCAYAQRVLNAINNKMQQQTIPLNIKLIEKAIIFAKKWHDGQFRDTGEPFYSHPLAVAEIVAEYYLKTDVLVAAILHDVIEDSNCTIEAVIVEFNPRIAQLVERLTKIKFQDGKKIKLTLQELIEKLYEANDNEALLIKEIDRLHNLGTIKVKSLEKQYKTVIETNNHLLGLSSYVADKLNIGNNFCLENKLFRYCRNMLLSK